MFNVTQRHQEIKDIVLKFENNFLVEKWSVNGIHIWPYIRIKLYFLLLTNLNYEDKIKCQEQSSVVKGKSFYVLKKVQLVFSLIISFFKNELFFFRLKPKK
ncbi:MAG: hypothetical protein ACI7YS_00240 [Flavobacterium sp.]